MSCSGGGSTIASGTPWAPTADNYTSPTYQQTGECSEGYLARAGNAEKNMDGGPIPINTITNVSIPVGTDMSVTTQMTVSPGSDPVASWTNGTTIPGVTFNTATGKFSGTATLPGQYSTTISALRADSSVIDSKPFLLVASKSTGSDSITFIHPLPGSVITARCTASVDGTQIWSDPKRGRPHKGIDLAYAGGALGNVRAAASGKVIRADGNDARGYGNVVFIAHSNAAGKKICITVYAHLSTIGVQVGQQVSAGDVVGVEGATGDARGAHLHFEIRSPDFSSGVGSNQSVAVYDPAAYISGQVSFDDVTGRTQLNNNQQPDPGVVTPSAVTTQTNSTALAITPAMTDNQCSGYTPEPGNAGPGEPTPFPTTPTATGACFTDASNFVMRYEVGPQYNPNDPATIAGDISTPINQKKCGWVVDTGGNTKYGIAQKFNPSVNVQTLNLAGALSIFQDKYWSANSCDQLPNPLCIVHYNGCVNPGPGAAIKFLQKATNTTSKSAAISAAAGLSPSAALTMCQSYINSQQNYYNDLANGQPAHFGKYLNGWTARMNALKAFIASSASA